MDITLIEMALFFSVFANVCCIITEVNCAKAISSAVEVINNKEVSHEGCS